MSIENLDSQSVRRYTMRIRVLAEIFMGLNNKPQYLAGIDAGSVTLKLLVSAMSGEILFCAYERHRSDPLLCLRHLLEKAQESLGPCRLRAVASGSAGFLIAQSLELEHYQEVFAAEQALSVWAPQLQTAIELGGEDAKIIFFNPPPEQRMNGTCAGGTGAFIDQMAALLQINPQQLDDLAGQTRTYHAIASRCGVFAKSDVQGLLARGLPLPEVARSVMRAVVLQTISGLGFGRRIQGPLAFLGGPFHHLPSLKAIFSEQLNLTPSDIVPIRYDLYAVAYGCTLSARSRQRLPFLDLQDIRTRLDSAISARSQKTFRSSLPALGPVKVRQVCLPKIVWPEAEGPFYLGIDSGSTTSKLCLCDCRGRIVFERYRDNGSSALSVIVAMLLELYRELPSGQSIAAAGATGYGEPLLKAALGVDIGEVETLAHSRAATSLTEAVDVIFDIGGQDMKYIHLRDGQIDKIVLNEACSSGCGSFLQTFSSSLGLSLPEFCRLGLQARHPADLGTRCTVFMNSKIKEAQRDGIDLGDLSAGLAYSVIRNALYKVLKLAKASEFGPRVFVQGGTFRNDAVLMALVRETGADIVRPDHPELMGAFGMALLARERQEPGQTRSRLLDASQLAGFTIHSEQQQCRGCTNRCSITSFKFPGGGRYRSGNRCELHNPEKPAARNIPNLYRYKRDRLFAYPDIAPARTPLGTIGLPRVLNIYEHFPFWYTLFSRLGYRVQLSPPSRQLCPSQGWEYLSSEAICYPAKLVYTHVLALIQSGVRHIFFPCLPREETADGADFRYNCPIVGSFPEVIAKNLDPLHSQSIRLDTPFLPIHRRDRLWKYLRPLWPKTLIRDKDLRAAVQAAYAELDRYRSDLLAAGSRALDWLRQNPQSQGLVLAGRPYHLDDEVHHGIPEMIESLGVAVISEDALPELAPERLRQGMRVIDQWSYHHRLYNAAHFTAEHPSLQMVQLNSFGCGLDAVTVDQVEEILHRARKHLTLLKIDENSQLGAARIRLRSLFGIPARIRPSSVPAKIAVRRRPESGDTILVPQMSPIHFRYLETALQNSGYPVQVLPSPSTSTVETGLHLANNDICYPAIIIIGQMVEALRSGRWDPERVTLLLSQTGGGCRASNYVALLERALDKAGYGQVPVLTLAGSNRVQAPAIRYSLPLIKRIILSQSMGDLELRLRNRFHPYCPSPCREILDRHRPGLLRLLHRFNGRSLTRASQALCREFLPFLSPPRRPRVGLVGEIFIKYNELGNNHLIDTLENEGFEVLQPDIVGFAQYCAYDRIANHRLLGDSFTARSVARLFIGLSEKIRRSIMTGLSLLTPDEATHHSIDRLTELAAPLLSTGNQCGEGWYLTAEMAAMIESGIRRIVCVQPFGCLANHICGRGMIKPLQRLSAEAAILPLDFDPGSSAVNQYNRLKLFLGDMKNFLTTSE